MVTAPPAPDEWELYNQDTVIPYSGITDGDGTTINMTSGTCSLTFVNSTASTTHLTLTTSANGNGSVVTLGNGTATISIKQADYAVLKAAITETDGNGCYYCVANLQITVGSNVYLLVKANVRIMY